MARKYTAEELIAQVRDEARIPDTASTGNTDADILNRINEFVLGYLSGLVMEVREEYFIRTTRTPLVANTSQYRLPTRAMYQKLRDVRYKTGSAGYLPLAHATLASLDMGRRSLDTADVPGAFYIEGNYVTLWPAIGGGPEGSLDMAFYFAPGELVLSTATAVVTGVAGNEVAFAVDAMPTAWTASDLFDAHSPSSGAEIKVWDRKVTEVDHAGRTITFSEAIDGSTFGDFPVEAGDYITLAGEAAIPGVPRELHPLIGLGAACSVLEDEGDLEVFAAKTSTLNRQLFGQGGKTRGAIGLLENRIESRPTYVKGGRLLESQAWWL